MNSGGSVWQIACELIKFIQVPKNEIFAFSLSVPSQLILKHAYMPDILICHIVHMKYFYYPLPVLQNFMKMIWVKKTWMKFNQVFWHKLFL